MGSRYKGTNAYFDVAVHVFDLGYHGLFDVRYGLIHIVCIHHQHVKHTLNTCQTQVINEMKSPTCDVVCQPCR